MSVTTVEDQVRGVFAAAGARGALHVRQVDGRREVSVQADAPVLLASVVKIVFALAFAREVAAGRIDPTERAEVPKRYRVGGTGTTGCLDPVQMSLRDLALFMMTVSDNAATDVIYHRVGRPAIDRVVADLGLAATHVRRDMLTGHHSVVAELGLPDARDLDGRIERADEAAVRRLSLLDPATGNTGTARDIGRLLEAIWTDRAGPPQACAFVRSIMGQQVTTHRLASGFPGTGFQVAGKTGSLPGVRNEAGVVTYPDGRRYVAAVFTTAHSLALHLPAVDGAIGAAARAAVDHLRAPGP